MPDKKLFIIINEDRFFLSHRKDIGLGAREKGWDVTIVAKDTGVAENIRELGLKFLELPINPTGKNIFQELGVLKFLSRLYRKNPDAIFHHVGFKILLWGGVAARLHKVRGVVNAISGMGTLFTGDKPSPLTKFIFPILKFNNSHSNQIFYIFQNLDDERIFKEKKLLNRDNYCLIKGSGVNLEEFDFTEIPEGEPLHVVYTGRMLREKGVVDMVKAAEILRPKYEGKVSFILCGGLSSNPSALSEEELQGLVDGTYIVWMHHQKNVKKVLQECVLFCFPSYREGFPKSVIEASAVGRPIVTYDSIGCRDTVEDGVNGYKVALKDYKALARKIDVILSNQELARDMGAESRKIAERDYNINDVVSKHLDIYESLFNGL